MKKASSVLSEGISLPRIVFFAVRSHHYRYFSNLVEGLPGSRVVDRKAWWRPSRVTPPDEILAWAVRSLMLELVSKWPWLQPLSPLIKICLSLRARLLCACYCRMLQATRANCLAVWNGQRYRQLLAVAAARALGLKCLFFENGLLPDHTTIDARGINYLNSMPRFPEAYASASAPPLPPAPCGNGDKTIFVPFQVETDSQILFFSPWIHSMRELATTLIRASESLPQGWRFICKLHPKEPKNHRRLRRLFNQHPSIELVEKDADTREYVYKAGAVLTINSTAGVEAMLERKKVIVLGHAFYAIKGMVLTAHNPEELNHALSRLPEWQPDGRLVEAFLAKLVSYQVPGDWRKADRAHYQCMRERIRALLGIQHA